MKRFVMRGGRVAAVGFAAFGVLWLRFSAGIWPENEVSGVVHWGLLPIAFLLGFGAWALEMSRTGSLARRDTLWGVAGALSCWALLRLLGGA
jgi:hypothetical protein